MGAVARRSQVGAKGSEGNKQTQRTVSGLEFSEGGPSFMRTPNKRQGHKTGIGVLSSELSFCWATCQGHHVQRNI